MFSENPFAEIKKIQKYVKTTITFSIKIDKQSSMFSENPCAKMQKTQKC